MNTFIIAISDSNSPPLTLEIKKKFNSYEEAEQYCVESSWWGEHYFILFPHKDLIN